jgi:TRAP-type C4-dicarboxylate transport system permease small subunit
MNAPVSLVLQTDRNLKWKAFDILEWILMILCGITLGAIVILVFFDVITRVIGRPWLWLQEVTSAFFIYGIFFGMAVAVRRNDHLLLTAITEAMSGRLRLFFETMNRLVVLGCGLCMTYFGSINFSQGFGSFRMPSSTPIAYWYAAIPIAGTLIALFTMEQLVNGWRYGFQGTHEGKLTGGPGQESSLS